MRDSFLLTDEWWQEATRDLRNLAAQHDRHSIPNREGFGLIMRHIDG